MTCVSSDVGSADSAALESIEIALFSVLVLELLSPFPHAVTAKSATRVRAILFLFIFSTSSVEMLAKRFSGCRNA